MRALVQVLQSRWPDTAAVARRIGGGAEDVAVVNGLAMLLGGRAGVTTQVPVPSLWIAMVPECREVLIGDYQNGQPQVVVADSGHRLHLSGLRVQRVDLPEGVEPPWAHSAPDDMPVSEIPEPVGGYFGRGRGSVPMQPTPPGDHDYWNGFDFLAAEADSQAFNAPFAAQPGFVGRSRRDQGYSEGSWGVPGNLGGSPGSVPGAVPAASGGSARHEWPQPSHDLRASIAGMHDASVSMGMPVGRQPVAVPPASNGHRPSVQGQGPVTKAELRNSVVVAGLANGKWAVWSGGHVRNFFDSQPEALASAEQTGLPVCLATADGITRVSSRPVGSPPSSLPPGSFANQHLPVAPPMPPTGSGVRPPHPGHRWNGPPG